MTEQRAERYRRLANALVATAGAVADAEWSSPSPCEGWTARDVAGHVVETSAMFLGFVGLSLGEVPSVGDDPVGAVIAATARVQAVLDDPGQASLEFDGYLGRTTIAEAIDRFLSFDVVVHRWDLARATGGDERIGPADVRAVMTAAEAFGDAARSPNVFGPAVEPPPDGDEQARMLAFLGRQC